MRAPEMLSKYDLLTHIDQCLLPPPAACGWVSSYPGNWPPPRPLPPPPQPNTAATGGAESQLSAATQQTSTVTMTLQRPPSLVSAGSRLSLYSTTSTVRTSRGGSRNTGQRGGGR